MVQKIKENNTMYIKRCNCCKSVFSYDIKEYASSYGYDNAVGIVRCPYCDHKNKIKFKIRYKSSKKVNEDYKIELERVNNRNEELKSIIEKLESKNKKLEIDNSDCKKTKILYEDRKAKYDKLYADFNKIDHIVNDISEYIDDYMNSPKKNNLATKYLKEIQEIIKN